MRHFRKRPVVITAYQWNGEEPLPSPLYRTALHGREDMYSLKVVIQTLEGPMKVTPSDWIVTGIAGEVYNIKDEIFKASYEEVDAELDRMDTGGMDVGRLLISEGQAERGESRPLNEAMEDLLHIPDRAVLIEVCMRLMADIKDGGGNPVIFNEPEAIAKRVVDPYMIEAYEKRRGAR